MKVIILENYDEVSREAARIIARQVLRKPASVLGLATGSTPEGTYANLARMCDEGLISFQEVVSYNLDEYVGLKPEHEQSYSYFMKQKLFDHIDIRPENTHLLSGIAEDVQRECDAYEMAIDRSGGIDLQLLGIGGNGHIAFNEPSDAFAPSTHRVKLDERTCADNARFFDRVEDVPSHALSMGIGSIMRARSILLLATGKNKAEAIRNTVQGPVTPQVPASVLQLHPDVTLLIDAEAASLLLAQTEAESNA